jgi:hypothetical protein
MRAEPEACDRAWGLRANGYVCVQYSPFQNLSRDLFLCEFSTHRKIQRRSMAQRDNRLPFRVLGCTPPNSGATRRCPARPSTQLGRDQVNVLLFFANFSVILPKPTRESKQHHEYFVTAGEPVGFCQRRPISPRVAKARGAVLRAHMPCTVDTTFIYLARSLLVSENIVPVLLKREDANSCTPDSSKRTTNATYRNPPGCTCFMDLI